MGSKEPDWSAGFLYVATMDGEEVPGSRRYLTHCTSAKEYGRVRLMLESLAGEDCIVLDSETDRKPPGSGVGDVLGLLAGAAFLGVLIAPAAAFWLA